MSHTLFALLLFLKKFSLTGDITSITLGCHVFADSLYCFPGNDFGSYGCLDGYVELLARDEFLEFLADFPAEIVGVVHVYERRQCIGRLSVEQYVEFDQFGILEAYDVVVEGCVTL